jgi:hypothetical protein
MSSLQYAEEAVRLLKDLTLTPQEEEVLALQMSSLLKIVKKSIAGFRTGRTSGDSSNPNDPGGPKTLSLQ